MGSLKYFNLLFIILLSYFCVRVRAKGHPRSPSYLSIIFNFHIALPYIYERRILFTYSAYDLDMWIFSQGILAGLSPRGHWTIDSTL